jgi:hypothetical protein
LNILVKNTFFAIADSLILAIPLIQYSPLRERILEIPLPLLLVFGAAIPIVVGSLLVWYARTGRQFTIVGFYLLFYLLLTAVWPWPPLRFLVVVAPFLLLYLLKFAGCLLDRVLSLSNSNQKERVVRMAAVVVISVGVLLDLTVDYEMLREETRSGSAYFQSAATQGTNAGYMQHLFKQVADHTPPNAIVASVADPLCYLYTGRKTVSCYRLDSVKSYYVPQASPHRGTSAEEILQNLSAYGVNYLVIFPGGELYLAQHLKALRKRFPDLLTPVFMAPRNELIILKVNLSALGRAH